MNKKKEAMGFQQRDAMGLPRREAGREVGLGLVARTRSGAGLGAEPHEE